MERYEFLRVVGKGSYGEVTLVCHKLDHEQYVIKKQNPKTKRERRAAEQEAQLLSQLKHLNIVTYRESWEGGDHQLYIVMGFCEGGDLYHRLKQQNGELLPERQVVDWFVQIAMALQYLHRKNILHRDLKTRNIFLTGANIIKVGDLGIARVLKNQDDMASTPIGTPNYMSPERVSMKPYNYKLPQMPKNYDPQLGDLIRCMLSNRPDDRPDVHQMLQNPYLKQQYALILEDIKDCLTGNCQIPKKVNCRPSRDASEVPLVQKQESQYVNSELKSRGEILALQNDLQLLQEKCSKGLHPPSSSSEPSLSRQSREKKGKVAREESKMKAAIFRPLPPLRKKVTFVGINRIEGGEAEMVKHPPHSQADHQHEPAPQEKKSSCHHSNEEECSSSTSSTERSEGDYREGKSESNKTKEMVQMMMRGLRLDVRDLWCEQQSSRSNSAMLPEFKQEVPRHADAPREKWRERQ